MSFPDDPGLSDEVLLQHVRRVLQALGDPTAEHNVRVIHQGGRKRFNLAQMIFELSLDVRIVPLNHIKQILPPGYSEILPCFFSEQRAVLKFVYEFQQQLVLELKYCQPNHEEIIRWLAEFVLLCDFQLESASEPVEKADNDSGRHDVLLHHCILHDRQILFLLLFQSTDIPIQTLDFDVRDRGNYKVTHS
jgi:hypothetical protein